MDPSAANEPPSDDLGEVATSGEVVAASAVVPSRADRVRRVVALAVTAAAWGTMAVLAWTALSRWVDVTPFASITVLLQALTPLLYLPVYLVAVLAAWRRRWSMCAVAGVLALVHVISVAPALGSTDVPGWAAGSPRLSVIDANVYDQNPQTELAARTLLGKGADVLVLEEVTADFHDALRRAGLDNAYPYQQMGDLTQSTNVEAIFSKVPFTQNREVPVGHQDFETAIIDVQGADLLVVAVHVSSARHSTDEYRLELGDLERLARSSKGAVLLAGDFNSNRWNTPFADLLDSGLTDAHESRGKGLSFSWPASGWIGPLMRLDHALVDDQAAVERVDDITVPGSDHVGMALALAVRRATP